MKQKILVVSLMVILLIGTVSTPVSVLATDKKDSHDDDDHKTHNSCQNIPKETPFRDIWVFVCSLQTQIDQINVKLNQLSTGGGTGGGGSTSWCPTAKNINLVGVDLRLHSLVGCDLSNAKLTDSNLQYVNLIGANLTNADFSGTDLSNADLTNAILKGTNFQNSNLFGMTATGCHGIPIGSPLVGLLPSCGP
jgi:hypothetical protein